jgi:hypothetical protein
MQATCLPKRLPEGNRSNCADRAKQTLHMRMESQAKPLILRPVHQPD